MENRQDILYMVIPCYNEQEVLPETSRQLKEILYDLMDRGKISRESRVLFVNDGSKDETWDIIEDLHAQDPLFLGLKLSRDKGHQNALLAGLMTAKEYGGRDDFDGRGSSGRCACHRKIR